MQNDTVFGKIITGEIPSIKVYEDDHCLAFLDINPVSKGHTLLIPKTGYGQIDKVPDEVLGSLMATAKRIVVAMKQGIPCDFVQIDIVGKDIPEHFHIHLIPRTMEDDVNTFRHTSYEEGEKEVYAEKIQEAL
jgi:histidine triad (HIT) family protein